MPDAADIEALAPVVRAFDDLGIFFYIGGSVASNVHGVWRATMDTDLIADVRLEHVRSLVTKLDAEYYISEEMMRDAITDKTSFNLIHNATAQKVDVFIPQGRPYDRLVQARAARVTISEDGTLQAFVASAEDIILTKLVWFRLGGEVSQNQWSDLRNVMRIQMRNLDQAYIDQWAHELQVTDLLERLRAEVED